MPKARKPKLSPAVFCHAAAVGDNGLVDCRGVFSAISVWGFPSSNRVWHAVLAIADMQASAGHLAVSIARGRAKRVPLAEVDFGCGADAHSTVIPIRLAHQFAQAGLYTVRFALQGVATPLNAPLEVVERAWPEFSEEERARISQDPAIPNAITAHVVCAACSRAHVFEDPIVPAAAGADSDRPFPASGAVQCGSCGREMHLRDIQGQLRQAFKTAVAAAMNADQP